MNLFNSFYSMFGATGVIALILSLFFGTAALINAWRRRAPVARSSPRPGPILMSDPHSGTPVTQLDIMPLPPPEPPAAPADPVADPPDAPPSATPSGPQYFRQLDARGVDVDATRGGKHDEYVWE